MNSRRSRGRGAILEIWNLVFMQFDRGADGVLTPLPKPSVDTGAGLERIAAVMQGKDDNFHTDLFMPLIAKAEEVLGMSYDDRPRDGVGTAVWPLVPPKGNRPVTYDAVSFRVLADHARAITFLIADGVFPSNEGRGYVLRRILRRGVRHAWLLGRREPTLDKLVSVVVEQMKDVYPELAQRRSLIVDTTRAEEERFLATIEEGMLRFDQLAPASSTQGSTASRGTISGGDAFRLYDTFGFPIDLTELMAHERGYSVDIVAFEEALQAQRSQSREERKGRDLGVADEGLADIASWERKPGAVASAKESSNFVGYGVTEADTEVVAIRRLPGKRIALVLQDTPFYAESGGQISDAGAITGDGWSVVVDEVKKVDGRHVAVGELTGDFHFGRVHATVPAERRRDTERNHTATHLLHAALRQVLGEHVTQAGSLVAPDRFRFDFHHHGPIKTEQLSEIEELVNRGIWANVDVNTVERPYRDAVASGAMALFGEKYGDVVRVVSIPGLSVELCGGTHARSTGQIALFKIVSETGVSAGVRRIEAVTGPRAYELIRGEERKLQTLGELLRAPADGVVKRVETLLEERRKLEKRLEESLRGGGDQLQQLLAGAETIGASRLVSSSVTAGDVKELQQLGDALREQLGSGVGVLATSFGEGKSTLLVVVTDDLRDRGVRADQLIKPIAEAAGGRGGGKAHMAQAGIPDASRIGEAIASAPAVVRAALVAAA
jgi:alanyl-tRNA synthetase